MNESETSLKEGRINNQLEEKLESFSAQVEANVEQGRAAVAEWRASMSDKASELGRTMDRYTREKPWQMVSWALIGGMLLGLLCGCDRRR
jgi:ElaB/YqjD/DUF883 family membrane-anchored ribosome-binding protein